ncbi:MAG: DsbA family protein [Solirubrobacterales bacterium]|nr:DsbA family protein [Solirubrobacterales bacterium]
MNSREEHEHAAKAARVRRISIIGGVLGLALIAVVVAVIVGQGGGEEADPGAAQEVNARFAGIPQTGITLGDPAAKATIVEYADLRCPFCKEFDEQLMPTIVNELIKTGKAKMMFRALTILDGASPSGRDSSNAANYAAATGLQNKMFQFLDLFYQNQGPESEDYATESFVKGLANQVGGLDANEAWANRNNPKVTNQNAEAAEVAAKNGVRGTPTVFVGSSEDTAEKVELTDLSDPQAIIDAVDALQ